MIFPYIVLFTGQENRPRDTRKPTLRVLLGVIERGASAAGLPERNVWKGGEGTGGVRF